MIEKLISKNRSYRRFNYLQKISPDLLLKFIDLARKAASGRNLQPLKYILSTEEKINNSIFSNLTWAGYLSDWSGPLEDERPSAFIIVLHDKQIKTSQELLWCDLGLACQNILLGAVENKLGGCLLKAFHKKNIINLLKIDARYDPLLIIALGQPKEKVVLTEAHNQKDIKYFRDEKDIHYVPKRKLTDLILKNF